MSEAVSSGPERRMTADEFALWTPPEDGQKYELVNGEIVAMGNDRARHNRTKFATGRAFYNAIERAGLSCEAFIDGFGVKTNEYGFRLPDVLVQCEPIDDDAAKTDNPVILVEVLSPGSLHKDLTQLIPEYFAIPSVMHYLVLSPEERFVVHHRRQMGDTLETRIIRKGDAAPTITMDPPGITIAIDDMLGL